MSALKKSLIACPSNNYQAIFQKLNSLSSSLITDLILPRLKALFAFRLVNYNLIFSCLKAHLWHSPCLCRDFQELLFALAVDRCEYVAGEAFHRIVVVKNAVVVKLP